MKVRAVPRRVGAPGTKLLQAIGGAFLFYELRNL